MNTRNKAIKLAQLFGDKFFTGTFRPKKDFVDIIENMLSKETNNSFGKIIKNEIKNIKKDIF